jgi:hypothetical protein
MAKVASHVGMAKVDFSAGMARAGSSAGKVDMAEDMIALLDATLEKDAVAATVVLARTVLKAALLRRSNTHFHIVPSRFHCSLPGITLE